jgi:Undecaprenyl-phosphate galactose phosphotransferase WbaP
VITENFASIENTLEHSSGRRARLNLLDGYARPWMAVVLMLTDFFSLYIAFFLTLQLRWFAVAPRVAAYDQVFSLLVVVLLIKLYRSGLYPGVGLHYVDELRHLVNGVNTTFIIVFAATFLLKTASIYSRITLLFIWLLCLLLIPLGRYLVRQLFIRVGAWGVPVAIIGDPEKARKLADYFRLSAGYGIRPRLLIDPAAAPDAAHPHYPGQSNTRLMQQARGLGLKDALVLIEDLNDVDALIDRYHFNFQRLILIKDQVGKYGLSSLKPLDFSSVLGLQVKNNLLSPWSQFLKKLTDIFGSFLGLLLVSPLLGLISALIKLDSPGRIFYRQARIGRDGKKYTLFKFRTMHIGADQILKSHLAQDPELQKEWDCYQKLKNDPRITRFGKFLRKYSLDELPQLFNIVRGEMSLVGPRPILPDQQIMYGPYYKDYIQVVPGITGLWQVSGRNQTSFERRAELDNEYIQRWSIWMDIFILFKTIKVVFWHHGAY